MLSVVEQKCLGEAHKVEAERVNGHICSTKGCREWGQKREQTHKVLYSTGEISKVPMCTTIHAIPNGSEIVALELSIGMD